MYNLLMKSYGDYDEWEQNQGRLWDVSFLTGRIFEHTEEILKQEFTGLDGPNYDALIKLPCLFTYEGGDVVGSIGRISEVKVEAGKFEITYTLPDVYPKIQINEDTVSQALGMGSRRSRERGRTHWAVKNIDLFEVTTKLLRDSRNAPILLSDLEMNRIWGEGHKGKQLVFLSHRAKFRRQVSDIKVQLENQGLRCFLAHDDVTPSMIWQNEILNALNTMHIFIGFVTDDFHGGGWPDQEIGYAYQRNVVRVFVKLGDADPVGMVAREQALRADWDNAAQQLIAHLQGARML